MSSHPAIQRPADPARLPMTLPLLAEKKRLGEPIVMVTAYDYPSARAAEAAGVDLVLVGDSAATTVLGYTATTPVELEDMLVLDARGRAAACARPLLVGDLPFGSYEVSDEQAIATAMRMVKEAGCEVVKLEGGGEASASRAHAIVGAGIPVMGHVGLTPQTSTALGGWKAQGRNAGPPRGSPPRRSRCRRPAASRSCSRRSPRGHRGADAADRDPRDRDRRRPGDRRPGARLPRPARHPRRLGPRFVKRYANLQQEMNEGVERVRRGRARAALPGSGAHLLDRPRGAAPSCRRCWRCVVQLRSGSP